MTRRFIIPSLLAAGFGPLDPAAAFPVIEPDSHDAAASLFDTFHLNHAYTLAGHRSHSSHASHSSHRSSAGSGYTYVPPAVSDPTVYPLPPPAAPAYQAPVYTAPPSVAPRVAAPALLAPVPDAIPQAVPLPPPIYIPPSPPVFDANARPAAPGVVKGVTPAKLPTAGEDSNLVTLPGNSDKFKKIVLQVQTALSVYGYFTGPLTGTVGPLTKAALERMQGDYGIKVTGTITPDVLNALRIEAK